MNIKNIFIIVRLLDSDCDFSNPINRIDGGWPGISQSQCQSLFNCYDDTTPNTIWCFKPNAGKSLNLKCNFSIPKNRLDGGWPGISKLECESLGYCFDDTVPGVVWCIKSDEKIASRNCNFLNPQRRVDAGRPGISKEECLAQYNCFDDSTPNSKWCFKYNTGRTHNNKCDFSNPQKRVNGGEPGISRDACEALGYCFDDTILDVKHCFVPVL